MAGVKKLRIRPSSVPQIVRDPLYRSATALIASNAANGVLGLLYWIVAARLYSAGDVGRGGTGISALLVVSLLGWAGLHGTLVRFIPASGRGLSRLVRTSYLMASAVGLVAGVVFLLAIATFVEPLRFLTDSWGLAFLAAIVVWCVFALQDGTLIGLRRAEWVPIENTVFGIVKIALLVAFAELGMNEWGIVASWTIGAALLVVPVNLFLFLKLLPSHAEANAGRTAGTAPQLIRFSVGNHISQLLIGLPDGLMPVIVLQLAGAQAAAFFYAPRTIILSLRQVTISIANALTAEGAADEPGFAALSRRAAIFSALIFLPLTLLLLVGGEPLLDLFGPEYAENGLTLLRLFAIGLLPLAFVSLYLAAARVRRQVGRLVALGVVWSSVALGLGAVLIPEQGINGAGVAWLTAQVCTAFAAIAMSALGILEGAEARPPSSLEQSNLSR